MIRYRRHWNRVISDGSYFRTCPLIMNEIKWARSHGRIALVRRLLDEYREVWREGPELGAIFEIGPEDTFQDYDDSPEANRRWIDEFVRTGRP